MGQMRTEARVLRQAYRGSVSFAVVWIENGHERHQVFETEEEASDWLNQVAPAPDAVSPPVQVNAPGNNGHVSSLQLQISSYRGGSTYVVSWSESGKQHQLEFHEKIAAEVKLDELKARMDAAEDPPRLTPTAPVKPAAPPLETLEQIATRCGAHVARQVYRGQTAFVVSWMADGYEHHQSFETEKEAGQWCEGLVAARQPQPAQPPEEARPSAEKYIKERKILVVCPDDSTRESIVELLRAQLHTVEPVADETRAMEAVRRSRPEVVFLSEKNPMFSGLQICRQIRRSPEGRGTHIVLVASHTTATDQEWGFKQGANAYFTEPFDRARLSTVLLELPGGSRKTFE